MKKLLTLTIVLLVLLIAVPVSADPGTRYVDDDGVCDGNTPCYNHPQDAVNDANPGDTILVYPGTYGSRRYTSPTPPHWSAPNDQYAPALIVYKDGLTIEAVDPDPANTVIETTHDWWSNPVAIQASTGGTWDGSQYVGAGVYPTGGTAPNAVAIMASDVTIRGFTLRKPYAGVDSGGFWNTAGVMIGGLYAGDPDHLGSDGNTVENCVFKDVWHAVYIWHSSDNMIVNNTVEALGSGTGHWAAISTYDGYNDAQIELGNLSENNLIAHNQITDKGIALGAWAPPTWTSNAGSQVCHNTTTQVGVTYAHGPVIIGCNSGGFWCAETDNVLRITGITYDGASGLVSVDPSTQQAVIALSAAVSCDGSSDGSGIDVTFTVDGQTHDVTTTVGGSATTAIDLPPGVYTVEAKVSVCESCEFTDSAMLVVYDSEGGFVTGGGWIDSPEGAYVPDPSLTGKATFGFVSKYKKGAQTPEGQTEFVFKVADLNFHSSSYDWLVVAGAKAKFKGTGTINGEGEYKFMLTALDADINENDIFDVDRFRIKIWSEDESGNETVVYDNGLGADEDDDNAITEIGGGSIVIHTKKK